ncbi:MAG: LytTR family transcriptional regulator DNA-binding domain-containing protein [Bacteroidales bacterium]|nr:LytTR family transcriptional regulator DNA-binding domain-containing protein [Bacteroidales bacterium]MBN2755583.1 LytTR family transcriptional regulator DNA-binding domain-containing protein [Bacteroidales bacterium]
MEKASFILTKSNNNYLIDFSLDQIENLVNLKEFFRINRKYIININSMKLNIYIFYIFIGLKI